MGKATYCTGTLFKRGRIWYVSYYVNGRQVQRSSRSNNIQDAKRLRDQILGQKARGDMGGSAKVRRSPAMNCWTISWIMASRTSNCLLPTSGDWSSRQTSDLSSVTSKALLSRPRSSKTTSVSGWRRGGARAPATANSQSSVRRSTGAGNAHRRKSSPARTSRWLPRRMSGRDFSAMNSTKDYEMPCPTT